MQSLRPEQLRVRVEVSQFPHATTESVPPLEGIIGQERALRSLRFGLGMRDQGYHIFVAGPAGTGRTTAVRAFLEDVAAAMPQPPDWAYVYHFDDPYRPQALQLPPGGARQLQKDVAGVVDGIRRHLSEAFEGDQYTDRREGLVRQFHEERSRIMGQLEMQAQEQGFVLQASPVGLLVIPVMGGRPVSDQDMLTMDPAWRDKLKQKQQTLEEQVRTSIRQVRTLEKDLEGKLQALGEDVARYETEELLDELLDKYRELPEVIAHLKAMQKDIIDHLELFQAAGEEAAAVREGLSRRYQVNVLVDSSKRAGAPVVMEPNPSYPNVFGRIEKEARMGVLHTDFTLIRAGSLHQANGGFLVLHVEELFRNPFVWESLKRALRQKAIEVEDPMEQMGFLTTRTLRPMPIPLDLKVALVGSPLHHYLLNLYDPDFGELFKAKAEFEPDMERTPAHQEEYLRFLCTICHKEQLRHLDRSAVAKMLEHASRLAGDQSRISTRFADAADVVREANYWAAQEQAPAITEAHIRKAIEEKVYRVSMIRDRMQAMINDGTIAIDVAGSKAGQVNGLAVISYGQTAFGRPSRITATVGTGRAGVLDIEREARLSGRLHTKGVLILEGFLTENFARERPLALSARLVFEQSYEEIDGDSASSTELYALLSALSGLPIRQGLAVTGSVNQKGDVQAIGGVNEKIEGFFDICQAQGQGLTGEQGVLIPATNVRHLMLREDVVEAAAAGKFQIYPVGSIVEGIELLTGVAAGERKPDGSFPPDTVFGRVEARLRQMAEAMREMAGAVPMTARQEAAATLEHDLNE
jgi:lon-related putative ATP-dependent protease